MSTVGCNECPARSGRRYARRPPPKLLIDHFHEAVARFDVALTPSLEQRVRVSGVPGIVINVKWLISGGQPPEIFEQALRQIAAELNQAGE